MAPIMSGDVIPDGSLAFFDGNNQLQKVSVHSLAAAKKVFFFLSVTGAFTPTCSLKHVPGFIEKADELKSKCIHEILLISSTLKLLTLLVCHCSVQNLTVNFRKQLPLNPLLHTNSDLLAQDTEAPACCIMQELLM